MATLNSLYLAAMTDFDYEALEIFREQQQLIKDLLKRIEELESKLAEKKEQ
jgi:BMFP domain-containing protein YqiC